MIIKVLAVSAITAMLLFSGCENEAEDRMKTQTMLDSGDFDGVISALEDKSVKTDEDNLKLASAYMDKAGFSVTDLITIVANTEDDEASFSSFVINVSEDKTPDTLDNLQKAIAYYSSISTIMDKVSSSPSSTTPLNTNQLFLGMAYIAKVATVLSYMGDVEKLEESGEDVNILASGCALAKVYAPSEIPKECASVSYKNTVLINDSVYTVIEVILNNGDGRIYNLLATEDRSNLVLTEYTTNFEDTPYPMPVKDESLTVFSALIDTLNGAFEKKITIISTFKYYFVTICFRCRTCLSL